MNLMQSLPIYPVAIFSAFFVLFYFVLRIVGVTELRVLRSLLLSAVLLGAQWIAGLLTSIAELGWVFGTVVSVAIFYQFAKNKLKLPTWQLVLMPVSVSIVGHLIVAAIFMVYFQNAAGNT